jgi:hypothetical protein
MAAAGSGLVPRHPSARHQRRNSVPYVAAWMIFRPIVSYTPSPEFRSGWALKKKIRPIRRSGGA